MGQEQLLVSEAERADFERDGFLVVRGLYSAAEITDIAREVQALQQAEVRRGPAAPDAPMVYLEGTTSERERRILSRIERFRDARPELGCVVSDPRIVGRMAELLGDRPLLFKEKVNFKLPGSGGFEAHQDIQPRWDDYAPYFISVLVTIDESTPANGCLELAAGQHRRGMIGDYWEPLSEEQLEGVTFESFPTAPGDAVFFDCFAPHRSAPNRTEKQRRNLYLTFNRASDGDHRRRYFDDKRKSFPPDAEREQGQEYRFRV